MKNKNTNASRRILLKSIAAGSGAVIAGKNLPEKWAKPVVDSVMLPAHAETSVTYNYFGQDVSAASIESGKTFAELVTDSLVEDAHAQGGNPIIEMSVSITATAATVLFTPSRDPVPSWALFQSLLPTDGSTGTITLGPGGDCGGDPWPDPGGVNGPQGVRIVGYTLGDPNVTVEITGGSENNVIRQYVIQMGSGTASAVTCV